MFNIVIVLFYIIIICLIVYLIFISINGNKNYLTAGETIIIPSTRDCTVNRDLLPVLDNNSNICCYNNNIKTGAYRANTNSGQVMSVISTPTYYLNVCREYCNSGYTIINNGDILCNGETKITDTQSSNANACARITAPKLEDGTACRGSALPVALVNNNLLYAFHVQTNLGISQCNTLGPC
jgi:hypothetical protein